MRIDFEQMPDHSRIWIYQADRELAEDECNQISKLTANFLEEWTAHGSALRSSSRIFYNRFLVLTVDEDHAQASGCSIDTAFKFVRYLESEFNVVFMDRTNVAFLEKSESKELVKTAKLSNLKDLVSTKELKEDTLVFDNLVDHIGQFKRKWITPASNTWLKKYFA